ncbi:Uncharacterized conserved protein YcfJ, contains glycine zipper 2TM domain [Alteromonadaceae bacterium Bs31]|nr:Uncharacterized conserved protein YcfJ, contains glycine zipper 2TM domain [Alteromonadaceae bacterium Bs31]
MKSLTKTIAITTFSVACSYLAVPSFAQGYDRGYQYSTQNYQQQDRRQIDYAKVLSAEPIFQTIERQVPVENCWTEQLRQETPVYHNAQVKKHRSATGTILGAMIGGGIGNAVGAGDENKKVGTVVGALLGASIGNDVSRKHRYQREQQVSHTEVSYRNVQRCEVQQRTETEQVPAGYDVTYRYHGQTYHTQMDKHPGKRLKVAVSIEPLEH